MDELKLKLSTNVMRSILAKIVTKTVAKKLGYDIDILINEIQVETTGGKISLHLNVDAEMDNNEFIKILHGISQD